MFPERLDAIARDKGIDRDRIEVWFADEARIGQKNKITRRWARRGTRPSAPHDQRTASAYIFGAICPRDRKGAGLVMPRRDIACISLRFLARTRCSSSIRRGWHMSKSLVVPQSFRKT